MNNKEQTPKNKIIKIGVPIAMLAIIAGIWFWQDFQKTKEEKQAIDANLEFSLTVTDIDVDSLLEHKLPIIIDFGADECVPCQAMEPVLIEMNAEMQGKAIVQFVDVWKHPDAARDFPVQVIPTQALINADGTPYIPSDEVLDQGIEFTMYADKETDEHVVTTHVGGLTKKQMEIILADMGVEIDD